MNRRSHPHNSDPQAYPWLLDAYNTVRNMLPVGITMSEPPNDVRNISDDRINPEETRRSTARGDVKYETTIDGDVVVVQPSFDDSVDRSKSPTSTPVKPEDWQARSPEGDSKNEDPEHRNPSSPQTKETHQSSHSRSLSGHFFDATSLTDKEPIDPVMSKGDSKQIADEMAMAGRKHRRMFSNEASNPPIAHRRINSSGNATTVERQRQHHHREDSGGLDILSAAVDVNKDDFVAAVGALESVAPWDPQTQQQDQRPSIGHVSTGSYEQQPYVSGPHSVQHPAMNPPPALGRGGYTRQHPPGYLHHLSQPSFHQSQYPTAYPQQYYSQGYPPRSLPPQGYPVQYSQRSGDLQAYPKSAFPEQRHRPRSDLEKDTRAFKEGRSTPPTPTPPSSEWNASPANHQGSQTFVTAISVGAGNKTMVPEGAFKNAATNTEDSLPPPVPSHVGHHRKLSSFSSLGTFLGSSIFPGPPTPGGTLEAGIEQDSKKDGHHRTTSSSVSFLGDLNVGLEGTDAAFIRSLQASNSAANPSYAAPPRKSSPPPPPTSRVSNTSTTGGSRLAAGGTSKRVRRKCTVDNCPNRVVQGGLCISHGAKRKTCKHPGCTKNVKKAGLCSTHGPARKRCEAEGCQKVAVQGGRCIAHGAKKKLCSVTNCTKQAILAGMCKKHHDQATGGRSGGSSGEECGYCREIKPTSKTVHKSQHTRGLSIFQEISADGLQSLLNETSDVEPAVAPETRATRGGNVW